MPETTHRQPDPGASVQPPETIDAEATDAESPYNEAEGKHALISDEERQRYAAERRRIRDEHQAPRDDRPPSTARGVHHVALVCADVERTTRFYQDLLGFPLTSMFENRDLAGSTHFFFDIGGGNCLAFFDLPGVDPDPYEEVLGGLHHLAISMPRDQWEAAKARLDDAGIEYDHVHEVSLYFRGPDGERLELIADPLGWMYGERVD